MKYLYYFILFVRVFLVERRNRVEENLSRIYCIYETTDFLDFSLKDGWKFEKKKKEKLERIF